MKGLIFSFIILSWIEINHSATATNFSQCFPSYCYFWNRNPSYKELSKPCPKEHWTLEIYNKTVQDEVTKFISMIQNNGTKIFGYFVPLNLSCKNSTTCTWKHKNKTATHFNWETDFERNGENYVYYFRANTLSEVNKWSRDGKNIEHPYAKLCMKENKIATTTLSTVHQTVKKTVPHPTTGGNLYVTIALAVVGVVLVILMGVVVFVVHRKRLQNAAVSSLSSSTTTPVNNKIAQNFSNESGKTIYAEVPEAADDNYQNQTSMQYADLNWSTNVSKIQQEDSKSVEEQNTNYFGPMGDVYARVQKS